MNSSSRWDRRAGISIAGALCVTALLSAAPTTSPVADAAAAGDREEVHTLLKQAADVNAAQGDGMTALHWAAVKGDAELAQMLLHAGANLRATTRIGGITPLYLASQRGHATVLSALLTAGADAKSANSTGTTALMVAAASGHVESIRLLLEHGVDVNAAEPVRGRTALMYAAANDRAEAIALLASKGADLAATTKVVDLAALTRDGGRGVGFGGGNPPVPGATPRNEEQAGGAARPTAAARETEPPAGRAPGASTAQNAERPAAAPPRRPQTPGVDRQFQLNELVAAQGGLSPLLFAARQGYLDSAKALMAASADVNQVSAGDKTSPLMMAIINGHFDLAQALLDKGANVHLLPDNGAGPLYAVLNVQWAPKALYPQPRAYQQQTLTHLELMKSLLDKGADTNIRVNKKVWYSGYSFDLSGVDELGATAFWRAAYGSDVDAMRLLLEHGADPNIRTVKPAGRPRTGDADRDVRDVSGLPPVPVNGPSVTALHAAAGVGYGEGFAANAHRFAPGGMLAAVKYLIEEVGVDVNTADHEGNTALHHAAARGDNEMIEYLVSKGADVKVVNREGNTTADMANGPVQRIQPYPETIALLEKLGAKNNNRCVSC